MPTKLMQAAIAAKADGYEYMTSVVKSVFNTEYHHVVKIDEIIANGGHWVPAPRGQFNNWHGRIGQCELPANSINKSAAIARYCK